MKNAIFLLLSPVIILICGILLVAYYKRKNEKLRWIIKTYRTEIKLADKEFQLLYEEKKKLQVGNRKLRTENKELRLEKNKLKFASKNKT